MTALTQARNTPERRGDILAFPVGAASKGYAGSMVVLNAGYAVPGSTATGLIAVGRAEEDFDNTSGSSGIITVKVRRGTFKFTNHATDPVTAAQVGADCYIADDQTVAATSATSTRSRAGIVTAIESDGVWVQIGLGL